jgi:hypothetical protein
MSPTTSTTLSYRDRAVLRAVAAGRCRISAPDGGTLVIDGLSFCDQFVGPRLRNAGLIAAGAGIAILTSAGQSLLGA